MASLDEIGIVWGKLLEKKELTLKQLEEEIEREAPEVRDKIKDILLILYSLYLIDYEGDKIKLAEIISKEILEMPCLRCEKAKVCRVGAKNNPFRCEEFVKWFMKYMVE